ncbi:MAG: response regulator [Bacillus sp. (in: Bacteria)]|nr:response regulator [Bacillus sp. (in: firmicutes)]MCM1427014.1 response regulator [Eubacterium sp.]
MGNQLIWQERFNIGVNFIDREHKKLFGILNRLFAAGKKKEKGSWVIREGIKYFKEHATKHFSEEETYMASIGYEGFEMHRRLHDSFRKKTLPALEKELERTHYSAEAIDHFLAVCAGWLIGHTLTEDRAITGKPMNQWKNLLPEEEQEAMRNTIMELMRDMFQLKSHVVSDCYSGEKFGDGIYYRLVYGTPNGEQWETILIFEEKLIVNTVGAMMATEADTLNVVVLNAARYTAQQFVNRICEHFPSAGAYEMKEENLLTYEQFEKIFEERRPQLSLLFGTDEGYFAYCVTAPHLFQDGRQTAIDADNAVSEVGKYLKETHEASKRKKLVVVDDSDVALLAMKNLLQNDYEVTLAKSGLAAIRCLTLDRPDLILLDYEMPVCDGKQVLEMIRAEKDIADIPVIYVSSGGSKERLQQLLDLKPAGYLLKTMPQEDIKRGIDNYFKKLVNK